LQQQPEDLSYGEINNNRKSFGKLALKELYDSGLIAVQ